MDIFFFLFKWIKNHIFKTAYASFCFGNFNSDTFFILSRRGPHTKLYLSIPI